MCYAHDLKTVTETQIKREKQPQFIIFGVIWSIWASIMHTLGLILETRQWHVWHEWCESSESVYTGFPKKYVHISYFVVFCCGLVPVEWTYLTNPTMHQISHNAAYCNRNVHTCPHSCNKMVHCMIWDRCTVRFVRHIHLPISLRVTSLASIKKHGKANVWPW